MKKTLIFALCTALLLCSMPAVYAVENGLIGDVNNNGTLDSVDYLLVKRASFGTYNLSNEEFVRADIDKNNKINATDYLLIKRACFNSYTIYMDQTISVDGDLSDDGWLDRGWIEVGEHKGFWQTVPTTDDTISYRYQLRTDKTKLYVAVEVDCDLVVGGNGKGTNVRFWINTNSKSEIYTHFYDVNASKCLSNYNTSTTESSPETIENSSLNAAVKGGDGLAYVEFSINLDEFGGKSGFQYYIAVSNKVNQNVCLYHPVVPLGETRLSNLPYENWVYDTAGVADVKKLALSSYAFPKPEAALTMTQTQRITENFTSNATFATFLADAERKVIVPGLEEGIIPQGFARNPKTGYMYMSGYFSDTTKPSVIAVMNPKGEFVAEYKIYKTDGTVYTGHMGGLCVTENYIYFSGPTDSNGNYTVAEFALDELSLSGSHSLTLDTTVALPIHASYLSYDTGTLWVGTFYLPGSYELGKLFNTTTTSADGDAYGGYAAAFATNEEGRLVVDEDTKYCKPYHVLATPNKVQGFAYRDGKVALSISYGRNNVSYLDFFNIDINNAPKTITADGLIYPMTILDSTNRITKVTAMCMTEGMALSKHGNLLVLFESAADKYYNSKNPTDYIWEYPFPD